MVWVDPLVDFPCSTQPPSRRYFIATTERHMNSQKEWEETGSGGGGVVPTTRCMCHGVMGGTPFPSNYIPGPISSHCWSSNRLA